MKNLIHTALVAALFLTSAGSPAQDQTTLVEKMGPGLNQLIVHVAIDNAEMQSVAINHPAFGSTWRQNDLDLISSNEFRELLKKNEIQLVGWKEIKEVMHP